MFQTRLKSKWYFLPLNPKGVYPKGNQSWIFIGRTDAEAEASVLWPPGTKNWLIGKDPDAGKDWRQEKGQQRVTWLNSITNLIDMSLRKLRNWWWTGKPGVPQSMGSQRVGHNWVTELKVYLPRQICPKNFQIQRAGFIYYNSSLTLGSGATIWRESCFFKDLRATR